MAENEILDLGHRRRWERTRRALANPGCSEADVIGAVTEDIEDVCRRLPIALRKEPLSILLRPALNSPMQAQAVIASFTEKRLASIVQDSKKLARSGDPAEVAAIVAKKIIEGLVDQFRVRAGRSEGFRGWEARNHLVAEVAKTFATYEAALRSTIEASLRGGPMRSFKARRQAKPRMTARQVAGLSVATSQPDAPRAR